MPGKPPPTAGDFLQRVGWCLSRLRRLNEMKGPQFPDDDLEELISDKVWAAEFANEEQALQEARQEAAKAGREVAENMTGPDSLPVFRLVERVEHEGDFAALVAALREEQPLIEAACARGRDESAPAEGKPVHPGGALDPWRRAWILTRKGKKGLRYAVRWYDQGRQKTQAAGPSKRTAEELRRQKEAELNAGRFLPSLLALAEGGAKKAARAALTPDAKGYGFVSPRELADAHGLNGDALRKRLDRWRNSHADGWSENQNRKSTEAQFLYRPASVADVIQKAIKASGKTSCNRPAP